MKYLLCITWLPTIPALFGLKTLMQLIDWLFIRRQHYESWIIKNSCTTQAHFCLKKNVLTFGYEIALENIHSVNKSNIRQLPPIFYDWFTFPGNLLRYKNCWSVNDHLNITAFCCFNIRARTIYSWNSIQKIFTKNLSLKN